jgi:hypothetical protein
MKNWREKGRMIRSKETEKLQLVSSQQWNRPNDMFSSVCIQYASSDRMMVMLGDDDVSSDDNTDILSLL